MVEDFETARTGRIVENFYGKIDGQGHTITKTATGSDWFGYLRDGAEISNLVLNWKAELNTAFRDRGALISRNYGTLKNIILEINLSGAFPLHNVGGAVMYNYGSLWE